MPGTPDQMALMALMAKLVETPAMKKMAELKQLAVSRGLDESEVDKLVPIVCKFVMHHAGKEKLAPAAEFVAAVVVAAAEFPAEVAEMLEKLG